MDQIHDGQLEETPTYLPTLHTYTSTQTRTSHHTHSPPPALHTHAHTHTHIAGRPRPVLRRHVPRPEALPSGDQRLHPHAPPPGMDVIIICMCVGVCMPTPARTSRHVYIHHLSLTPSTTPQRTTHTGGHSRRDQAGHGPRPRRPRARRERLHGREPSGHGHPHGSARAGNGYCGAQRSARPREQPTQRRRRRRSIPHPPTHPQTHQHNTK